MAILKKIVAALIPMCMTGCYEDFVPETDVKPVLCINSLITAGEPIEVSVSHTWLYTDDLWADAGVDDAVVSVKVNGETVDADYLPKEGDHIKITADSRRYGHAEGEVTVPNAIPIESVNWKATLTDAHRDEAEMKGRVTFNLKAEMAVEDPSETENYYRFSYASFAKDYHGDGEDGDGNLWAGVYPYVYFDMGWLKCEAEPIFSEHIGVFESISSGESYGFTFFTDRQFSGKSYPLHILFADCSYTVNSKEWQPDLLDCGCELVLHSISESYYGWVNYVWQRDEGPRGDLSEVGFGEPLWGYSNVSTGAGVIAAQSSSSYTIDLREFIETSFQNK